MTMTVRMTSTSSDTAVMRAGIGAASAAEGVIAFRVCLRVPALSSFRTRSIDTLRRFTILCEAMTQRRTHILLISALILPG
jgi:hypothetical protein